MAKGMTPPDGEIMVDSRGRTSLARVRTRDYTRYLAREDEDGTITLVPAVTVTSAELSRLGVSMDQFLDNPRKLGVRRERPARSAVRDGQLPSS
jgi:hypothetical protein